MGFLWGFLATIALAVLAGLAVIYSGITKIAATVAHNALERWALQTTKEHSVRVCADDVAVPGLEGEELIEIGFMNFDGTCAPCQGTPGVERSAIGRSAALIEQLAEARALEEAARHSASLAAATLDELTEGEQEERHRRSGNNEGDSS